MSTALAPLSAWQPCPAGQLARQLGISEEAVQLTRHVGLIDLHIEPYLTWRLFRANLFAPRCGPPLGGRFFGHLSFPRLLDGGATAAMWSITTNPARTAVGRWRTFLRNLADLQALLASTGGRFQPVRTATELRQAWARGAHAAMVSIQGGNALQAAPDGPLSVPDQWLVRVTLVHLTNSVYGATSSPLALLKRNAGLTPRGVEFVKQLNEARIFVDLAHINRQGFFDAVRAHDPSQPLLVTHTGVLGVTPSWRNLDDAQIRAVAQTGGTIGVIFAQQFLRAKGAPTTGRLVVEHLKHIIKVAGDEFVSLGSDYDGAITPPPDLRSGEAYPRSVSIYARRRLHPRPHHPHPPRQLHAHLRDASSLRGCGRKN